MLKSRMTLCAKSFREIWIVFTLVSSIGGETSFGSVLQRLSDDVLGVKPFQKYLDSQSSTTNPDTSNLADIVKLIADNINTDIRNHVAALKEFNRAVLNDLKLTAPPNEVISPCCNLSEVVADVRFKTRVDSKIYCRLSHDWRSDRYFKVNTLSVVQENLRRTPTLKWQYFGARDGSSFVYPAVNYCLDNFDPRLRPWYYAAAGGPAKDVVILVDTSKTMSYTYGTTGITKLKVAVDAATTIVKTLTPNDRVNVLAFDESVRFPTSDSCYTDSLAPGTPQNIETLADFLDKLVPVLRPAQYGNALREAFKLLSFPRISQTVTDRARVILLLTDGRANANYSEVYCTLQEGNALVNNSVVVMTFGIDPTMTDPQKEFLQRIAQQDFVETCNVSAQSPEPPVGKFTHIKDHNTNYVRTQIGFYYDVFRLLDPNNVTFSVPYQDALGLGWVMGACLPVINATQLLGVTCVDIPLDLVFNELINFKLGQLSYAYVIDSYGRTLLHPAVPRPQTSDSDPVFIDISSLETSPGSAEIKKSMISGQSGRLRMNANLVKNRGSSQLQGVDRSNGFATFFWHPIPVMNTSVCLVIIDGETKKRRSWNGGSFPPVYLAEHVNYDNASDPTICNQSGIASTVASSVVKLAPMAFLEPFNYSLIKNELTPETKQLQGFLEGRLSSAGVLGVQDGVQVVVALTHTLDDIWMNTVDQSYWTYTSLRYIGTREGVFRMFPGRLMAKEYDPTKRSWYTTAVGSGQIGKITVSTPYQVASGEIQLTICQTVYEGSNSTHVESDPVFGVIGLSITLSSFYNLLVTEFAPCTQKSNQRCFVMDNSGFIVVHKNYISNDPPTSAEHITSKEPKIAYDLKNQSILTNDICADYANIRLQSFWRVQLSQIRTLSTCTIYPVEGSNIFIIAPSADNTTGGTCQCHNTKNGECLQSAACQCPCFSKVDFNDCSGVLNVTGTMPCLPPTTPLHLPDVYQNLLKGRTVPDCRTVLTDLFISQKMEQIITFLRDLKRLIPRGNGLPALTKQRAICAQMNQHYNNNEAEILKALAEVNFENATLEEIQRNLITWKKRVLDSVNNLRILAQIHLSGALNLHEELNQNLQTIQIEVGLVIARAIARLAVLNRDDEPDDELESYFRGLNL